MLQEGIKGFTGGMSTEKYMHITKCSKATATRDLTDLNTKNILEKSASGGRSTRYGIVFMG